MEILSVLFSLSVLLLSSGNIITTGTKVSIVVIVMAVAGIAGYFLLRHKK